MLEAARDAYSFANGRTREDLVADRMLNRALERAVEIVGEAASKVSGEYRVSRPDLPGADMIGMRNRLVHGYFDINPSILWNTVLADLPALIKQLESVLAETG
jgi:uncharacterized protein with HEPN domain